jgi:hypothetical protein
MIEEKVQRSYEHLLYSLRETIGLLDDDIYYADRVLYREDITDALNDAHRSVGKAMKLLYLTVTEGAAK